MWELIRSREIERQCIEELKATLNRYTPSRTNEEYRDTHKEQKNLQSKTYDNINKEQVKERNKAEEPYICNCGLTIKKQSLLRHYKSKFHQQYSETNI